MKNYAERAAAEEAGSRTEFGVRNQERTRSRVRVSNRPLN